MKILYLYQYFLTNNSAGGTRAYEFTTFLSEQLVNIEVISGRNLDSEPKINNNLFIHSTNTKYNNKMPFWRRILSFLHYLVIAFYKGLIIKDIDIIFATSTPLTIGLPAVLLKKLKRAKLIFEVRDVWPDVPIELGYIKNRFIIKLLKWFEMWIYKNSAHIIILSEGMLENLKKKGVDPAKMTVIENTAILYLYDQLSESEKPEEMKDKFVCIHPGTMGPVNGLDFILNTAKIIQVKDPEIVFLLIGKGKLKDKLQARVKQENISNIIFKDIMPKKDIVRYIKSSDIGIMCVDNRFKILEDNSANKFFDFLAAGLPVLINYGGWQKNTIEANECGYSCLNPEDMANKIIYIKNESTRKESMSINSRKLAENKYSDIKAKEKLLNIIANL